MRIIQVIENFFPYSIGGTETYVLNVAMNLISAGHTVYVMSTSTAGSKEYVYNGIPVYCFGIDTIARKDEYKGLCPPKGLEEFESLLHLLKPDIVHFNTFSRSINMHHLKAAKRYGAKTFLTPHISGVFCANGTLTNYHGLNCDGIVKSHNCVKCYLKSTETPTPVANVISLLSSAIKKISSAIYPLIPAAAFLKLNRLREYDELNKYADGVIAISKWIERGLKDNGINTTFLVEQGISQQFNKAEEINEQKTDILKLLFIGRFYKLKGLHILMSALSQIDTSSLVIDFICPKTADTYSDNIRKEIAKYNQFHIFENLTQDKINQLLPKYDFLILPSTGGEMSPLVVLEAFACGIPVIGSSLQAITDNVTDGINGRIFNVGDPNDLAKIISNLIIDIPQRVRLKANVKPPRNFSDVTNELLTIYQDKL